MTRTVVHQNAQYFGAGVRLGVWRPDPFSPDHPGRLVVRVDVLGPDEYRRRHVLAAGDTFPLPGGRQAKLVEIFVSPDGLDSAMEFDIPDSAEDQS